MKTSRISILVLLVGSLLLVACGSSSVPTASPSGIPTGGSQVVTLADQGGTIHLAVGESFLLKLGEEYMWNITISDQSVLSRVPNISVIRGAQGIYLAHKSGTVTLSATGDPQCLQSQPPCAMPSILFSIKIVIG